MSRHALSWMDDRVHTTTIQALRDAWRDRNFDRRDTTPAWLGLEPSDAQEGDALQTRLSSLLDGVEGDDVATLAANLQARNAAEPMIVDRLELTLARRTGTDMMAALCVLAEIHGMVPWNVFLPIVRGPARRANLVLSADAGQVGMTVPLSTEAAWSGGCLTIQRVLPNTFQIAVIGKPLSQVVSHPLLDPLGLTVDDIEIVNGRETCLRTSYQREEVAAARLEHADLASDESALDTPPPSRRKARGGDLKSPF